MRETVLRMWKKNGIIKGAKSKEYWSGLRPECCGYYTVEVSWSGRRRRGNVKLSSSDEMTRSGGKRVGVGEKERSWRG